LGFGSFRKRWLLYGVSSFDRLLSLTSLPPVSVYCLKVNACLTEFSKCLLPEGACLPYGVFSVSVSCLTVNACLTILPVSVYYLKVNACLTEFPFVRCFFCFSVLQYGVCFCFDVLIMISSSYLELSICDRACDVNCERDNSNLAVIQISDFSAIL
jgi:hypothetical protein